MGEDRLDPNKESMFGRLRTRLTNYIDALGWNRLGLHSSKIMDVMEVREVWRLF